jgi:hypothetical protein
LTAEPKICAHPSLASGPLDKNFCAFEQKKSLSPRGNLRKGVLFFNRPDREAIDGACAPKQA